MEQRSYVCFLFLAYTGHVIGTLSRRQVYRDSSETLPGTVLGKYYSTWAGPIRRGSRVTSRYVKSSQPHRHRSHYTDMRLGAYVTYYRQYPTYADTYSRMRNRLESATYVCANYEANENDTVMGVFSCPLEFEPEGFTHCCGESYVEFCCEPIQKRSIWSWLCGVLLAAGIFIGCTVAWRKEMWFNLRNMVYLCTGRGTPPQRPDSSARRRRRRKTSGRHLKPPAYSVYQSTQNAPAYTPQNEAPPPYLETYTEGEYSHPSPDDCPKTPPPPYEETPTGASTAAT